MEPLKWGKDFSKEKKSELPGFWGLPGGRLHGERLYLQGNAQHLMGRGSPRAPLLPRGGGCPAGSAPGCGPLPAAAPSRPRPRRLQRGRGQGQGRAAAGGLQRLPALAAGARVQPGPLRCGSRGGLGRAGARREGCGAPGEQRGRRGGTAATKPETFPLAAKSLGVTDSSEESRLRDRVDGRCKVMLESESFHSAQAHGEGWASILGFQSQILTILY